MPTAGVSTATADMAHGRGGRAVADAAGMARAGDMRAAEVGGVVERNVVAAVVVTAVVMVITAVVVIISATAVVTAADADIENGGAAIIGTIRVIAVPIITGAAVADVGARTARQSHHGESQSK
jgi:hypothetical protein